MIEKDNTNNLKNEINILKKKLKKIIKEFNKLKINYYNYRNKKKFLTKFLYSRL